MRRLDPLELLEHSGLDLSRPFTTDNARAAGLSNKHVAMLIECGLLQRPLRGVFHASHLKETLELKVACVRLVVPDDGVVTDRTAGWLHGSEMILAPNDHLVPPLVSVFQGSGRRLRNGVTASGERGLRCEDVTEVFGLRVTTPLRTACDLGRLLRRDSAFAALDAMASLGSFTVDDLAGEVERFKGYRGVRQLRAFAPLVDPGSESFGESVLRLRWYDAGGLPRPETQVGVSGYGAGVRLDIADRDHRYAAEYDGAAFHGPEQQEHDRERREWLANHGWHVDVFLAGNVFGQQQDALRRLTQGFRRAALSARFPTASALL